MHEHCYCKVVYNSKMSNATNLNVQQEENGEINHGTSTQ